MCRNRKKVGCRKKWPAYDSLLKHFQLTAFCSQLRCRCFGFFLSQPNGVFVLSLYVFCIHIIFSLCREEIFYNLCLMTLLFVGAGLTHLAGRSIAREVSNSSNSLPNSSNWIFIVPSMQRITMDMLCNAAIPLQNATTNAQQRLTKIHLQINYQCNHCKKYC